MRSLEDEVKKVADDLEQYVNCFDTGSRLTSLAQRLASGHRTLQQSLAKLFFLWIRIMAEKYLEHQYDARNEESVKRCHEIVTMWEAKAASGELVLDNDGIPYLPMI